MNALVVSSNCKLERLCNRINFLMNALVVSSNCELEWLCNQINF